MNKHRTLRLACYGRPFGGCCPYGVWEWVQPILFHGELAAVLYLGTYAQGDHPQWRQKSRQYAGAPLPLFAREKVPALKEAARFFAQFLTYELQLAEEAFLADAKQHVKRKYCGIVKNLIALRYRENLHLQDAAEACQVTPNYLSALLKSVTGKTFKELLTEQRLVEAEACLKYRTLSIAEIAAQCGFQDSNYFSVVFRKYFGASPSEYRLHWGTDRLGEKKNSPLRKEEGGE
ncbi:MAG: helix-turn-helix transcriptional regulator [Oligosphaeraceae bacterium]